MLILFEIQYPCNVLCSKLKAQQCYQFSKSSSVNFRTPSPYVMGMRRGEVFVVQGLGSQYCSFIDAVQRVLSS